MVPSREPERTEKKVSFLAWFWHGVFPLEVKFAMEKAVRMLLASAQDASGLLFFFGQSGTMDPAYRAWLTLHTVEPERHLYRLQMEASTSSQFIPLENLGKMAERAWRAWISGLHTISEPPVLPMDRARYERVARETLARQAELANQREDPAAIETARQRVLDAFRGGKRCIETDKEGVTSFRFDGRQYTRHHMGDWDEDIVFDGTEAFLADLRKFYHWRATRDTYPHSPPEAEVWKVILSRVE